MQSNRKKILNKANYSKKKYLIGQNNKLINSSQWWESPIKLSKECKYFNLQVKLLKEIKNKYYSEIEENRLKILIFYFEMIALICKSRELLKVIYM